MEKLTDLLIVGLFAYGGYMIYEEYTKQLNNQQVQTPQSQPTAPTTNQETKLQEQINEVVKKIKTIKETIAIMQPLNLFPEDIQKQKLELAKYINLYEQLTGLPYYNPPKFQLLPVNGAPPNKLLQPTINTVYI